MQIPARCMMYKNRTVFYVGTLVVWRGYGVCLFASFFVVGDQEASVRAVCFLLVFVSG